MCLHRKNAEYSVIPDWQYSHGSGRALGFRTMTQPSVFTALRRIGSVLMICAAFGASIASGRAETSAFTAQQRLEIVNILRDALKNDPTILADAIESLKAQGENRQKAEALKVVARERARLGRSNTDVVLGNRNGTLEVVEFYDPRCPYCRKVLSDIDAIVASEPDLRLVEKVVPVLGSASRLEAKALVAAEKQNGYIRLQKVLMEDSQKPSIERIKELAHSVGLNADRLEKDMDSPDVDAAIHENMVLAQEIGLEGTPTFVVGDRQIIPGAVSKEDLLKVIDSLKKH
jgi:protein-disulfide isomerase